MEPLLEPLLDKSKIDVNVYEINENTYLCTYTALWCGPCKRIKPKLIEIMSGHVLQKQEVIEKSLFKETINDCIPFFVILKNGSKIDSIQTSDENLLKSFLSNNGINVLVLNDDF